MSAIKKTIKSIIGLIILTIPIMALTNIRRVDLYAYCTGILPMDMTYIVDRLIIGIVIFGGIYLMTSFLENRLIRKIILIATIIIPFLVTPPPFLLTRWYQHRISLDDNAFKTFSDENPNIVRGKHVICFVSSGCEFCEMAAKKLSIIQTRSGSKDSFRYIAYDDNINELFTATHSTPFDHTTIPAEQFLKITHGRTPVILLVEDGKVITKYSYTILNEREIKAFLSE